MTTRIQIYAGRPVLDVLAAPGEDYGQGNPSGRLNTVCERYLAMVADELGRIDLTRGEWMCLLDANNGVEMGLGTPAGGGAAMIWANLYDSGPTFGERWGVDSRALAVRLQTMPRSSLLAIAEVIDRFWSRSEQDSDAVLTAAGVSLRGC